MLKPYKQLEEMDGYVVYEFKTPYLYALYLILIIIAIGYFAKLTILLSLGGFLMFLYFLFVSTQYMKLGRITKRAALANSIEMSGSKWSFAKPLRVKVGKDFT